MVEAEYTNEGAYNDFTGELEHGRKEILEEAALKVLQEIQRRKRDRIARDWKKWSWLEEGF